MPCNALVGMFGRAFEVLDYQLESQSRSLRRESLKKINAKPDQATDEIIRTSPSPTPQFPQQSCVNFLIRIVSASYIRFGDFIPTLFKRALVQEPREMLHGPTQ